MLADLFSSLDGAYSFWSWVVPILFVSMFISNLTWVSYLLTYITNLLFSFWKGGEDYKPLKLFLGTLMFFMIINNLIGLTPYTYGMTSSLWFNVSLALIMWLTLIIAGYMKSIKKSIAHLAPAGAPMVLIPFLVIIETISIMIRPLTLTVRLVANISAGHIVLSLVANVLSSNLTFFPQTLTMILSISYVLFELFVCFIQAYIFTLLISLYAAEHP